MVKLGMLAKSPILPFLAALGHSTLYAKDPVLRRLVLAALIADRDGRFIIGAG